MSYGTDLLDKGQMHSVPFNKLFSLGSFMSSFGEVE